MKTFMLTIVTLAFFGSSAFCDDSIKIHSGHNKVVVDDDDRENSEIEVDSDELPAKIEANQDGSSNIQQGDQRITTDPDGHTVITDGKDSIVINGEPKGNPISGMGNSKSDIIVDDTAEDKHVKITEHGIEINKGGKHVKLGN